MSLPTDWTGWLGFLGPYAAAGVALLAAVGSFVGTCLTLRNSRRTMQEQLKHDARERDRERTMALKRDVYIPIVEAVGHAQAALGQLTNTDVDNNVLAVQIAEDLAKMAKVHVVGSEPTIAAMMEYLKVLSPGYFQLMLARAGLISRNQAIAQESARIAAAEAAIDRFKQLSGELHIAGDGEAQAGRLRDLVQSEMQTHQEHTARRAKLIQEQAAAQLCMFNDLLAVLGQLADLLPPVVLWARRDLDMALNESEYRQLFRAQQEAMMQAARTVQENLRKLMGQ